jgi:hypothetical protein
MKWTNATAASNLIILPGDSLWKIDHVIELAAFAAVKESTRESRQHGT